LAFCVTGLTFLVTPMNWWARYTVWLYAVGLPCFALVLDAFVLRPPRRPVIYVWFLLCLGFLFFEGGDCLFQVAKAGYPGPRPVRLTEVLNPQNWRWPVCHLFPDTRDTIFERILRGNKTVAVGPLNEKQSWRIVGIRGQLSQPIGARKIVYLDESGDMAAQAFSQHVRYVVWDGDLPIPSTLESRAARVERAGGFVVLTLP
jgi:hypothetical protein